MVETPNRPRRQSKPPGYTGDTTNMTTTNTPLILVVDDYDDKRALIEQTLRSERYRTKGAVNGRHALQLVQEETPDLVITDLAMPVMDGYSFVQELRRDPARRFIPVLAQSGLNSKEADLRLAAEAGALSYLQCPFDTNVLLARVAVLLEFRAQFAYMAKEIEQLREQAHTDPLTGLANRRRFDLRLAREVSRSLRTERPFCLLLLDLDDFKAVNDRFGHAKGDEVLKVVGALLEEHTRGIDTAARVGGEEFAVILAETNMAGAIETAHRLRSALADCDVAGVGRVTASFGLARFPGYYSAAKDNSQGLYEAADSAVYMAKRAGKDRVCTAEAEYFVGGPQR
jgi:two-component system cell cycle response regulator